MKRFKIIRFSDLCHRVFWRPPLPVPDTQERQIKMKSKSGNHVPPLALLMVSSLLFISSQMALGDHNIQEGRQAGVLSTIPITDSGWSTETATSDCTSGQGDDTWELTLTQSRGVTITVDDCCCPGDYYEVRVDGLLIGSTPNLAPPWGCDFSGPNSSGSFTVPLCAGTHTITVRDAGFDGHTLEEIEAQQMCPAGFTVTGTLSNPLSVGNPATGTLGSTQQPVSPEAAQLQQQADAIAPYVVTDSKKMQKLLSADAQAAGVSAAAVEFGNKLVALNNKIMLAANSDQEAVLTDTDFAFAQPLFIKWAEEGNPCGDRDHPSPCPPRIQSAEFYSTEQEVKDHLIFIGFHQTAWYAGGRGGHDFTKVVDHPCGFGPFRTQAITNKIGECWSLTTQSPEPNPELLSYVWPYFAWGGYVRWWHLVFC